MDTSIIGPVTVMKSFIEKFGKHSSAVHGILVSCILLCAAFGSLFAGRLAHQLGRRHAMAFGTAVFAVGVALEAAAVRVIEGLGYGLFFSTQTVYICEIAPPKARGALTSALQFMTCVALVVGYFISYGTVKIPGFLSWRLPFIITDVMALMYLLSNLFLLPESPRWLMQYRNHHAAEKVWDALEVKQEDRGVGDGALNTAESPIRTTAQPNLPREEKKSHVNFRSLWTQDVRKQTFLAVFLLGFLQLCGIDAVLYVKCSGPLTTIVRGFFFFFDIVMN